ncbi:MAG: hypothetical protein L6R41_005584 [Letrouitia leprolyta]|nr:MAG: hypothetical protein L6R41_005584 [Letrouitia leprolyta]
MSFINRASVGPSGNFVSVGAGARWSDVYAELDVLGLGVAGGRFADVGVRGLITGGGMSYFASRYGFACDQVLNFEVALGNGHIFNANVISNSDLWFALKGGSNNFGIVTRFDLKTFPQGKIFTGTIDNPIHTLPEQVRAFAGFSNATSFDTNAALINTYAYTSRSGWVIQNLLVYLKHDLNPPALKPFMDIKSQLGSMMRLSNLSHITKEQKKGTPYAFSQLFLTRAYGNDPDFLSKVFTIANTALQSFAQVPNLVYALVFQPLPLAISSHSAKSGGNPLGLDTTSGPQVLALQTVQWSDTADDVLINTAARKVWQQADEMALKMDLKRNWIYLNYAAEAQDSIGSYGEENVRRLKEVSRKYDPEGLFQKRVLGGFKLWGKGGTPLRERSLRRGLINHVKGRRHT